MVWQKVFRETGLGAGLRQQSLLSTAEELEKKPNVSASLVWKKSPSSLQTQQLTFHRVCLMGEKKVYLKALLR